MLPAIPKTTNKITVHIAPKPAALAKLEDTWDILWADRHAITKAAITNILRENDDFISAHSIKHYQRSKPWKCYRLPRIFNEEAQATLAKLSNIFEKNHAIRNIREEDGESSHLAYRKQENNFLFKF